ncbi:MAG: tetraacyldisaccharide 4'-kinase [Bdellovibrionota bacterium]
MGFLGKLYAFATSLDRATTRTQRLPRAVVSVGNISVGGRAKTPMTLEVCRRLKILGRWPVVLTRGYGRSEGAPAWLRPVGEEKLELWNPLTNSEVRLPANAELAAYCGDEALEVAFQEGVDVLVGPDRYRNARAFLKTQEREAPESATKIVFVLDDGFQHWHLARDLDIVMIRGEDLHDTLLPQGRLREMPQALQRAGLIFEIGRDVFKRSRISETLLVGEGVPDALLVVTTRAPDPDFGDELARVLSPHPFTVTALTDHAPHVEVQRAMKDFKGRVLLGWKEFAKFLGPASLSNRKTALSSISNSALEILGLELEFTDGGRRLDEALRKLPL